MGWGVGGGCLSGDDVRGCLWGAGLIVQTCTARMGGAKTQSRNRAEKGTPAAAAAESEPCRAEGSSCTD